MLNSLESPSMAVHDSAHGRTERKSSLEHQFDKSYESMLNRILQVSKLTLHCS